MLQWENDALFRSTPLRFSHLARHCLSLILQGIKWKRTDGSATASGLWSWKWIRTNPTPMWQRRFCIIFKFNIPGSIPSRAGSMSLPQFFPGFWQLLPASLWPSLPFWDLMQVQCQKFYLISARAYGNPGARRPHVWSAPPPPDPSTVSQAFRKWTSSPQRDGSPRLHSHTFHGAIPPKLVLGGRSGRIVDIATAFWGLSKLSHPWRKSYSLVFNFSSGEN